jgi:hypothetical protein
MTEKDKSLQTVESVIGNIISVVEGDEWYKVAGYGAKDGLDTVTEAKWYGKRGILAGAVCFAVVSPLPPVERIKLIKMLATETAKYFSHKKILSEREQTEINRAKTVIKIAGDFLKPSS